tara:strand:+ start:44 stop:403 length:360 start_codon:yes stop_codon:yes gene_type:complete
MKYSLLIFCFLFSSCSIGPSFLHPAPTEAPDPSPQPPIVDPIDLIIDGNGTKELAQQSHIKPFMVISLLAVLICLIPFLIVRYRSQAAQLQDWSVEKYKSLKDWAGKKIKEMRDKKKED